MYALNLSALPLFQPNHIAAVDLFINVLFLITNLVLAYYFAVKRPLKPNPNIPIQLRYQWFSVVFGAIALLTMAEFLFEVFAPIHRIHYALLILLFGLWQARIYMGYAFGFVVSPAGRPFFLRHSLLETILIAGLYAILLMVCSPLPQGLLHEADALSFFNPLVVYTLLAGLYFVYRIWRFTQAFHDACIPLTGNADTPNESHCHMVLHRVKQIFYICLAMGMITPVAAFYPMETIGNLIFCTVYFLLAILFLVSFSNYHHEYAVGPEPHWHLQSQTIPVPVMAVIRVEPTPELPTINQGEAEPDDVVIRNFEALVQALIIDAKQFLEPDFNIKKMANLLGYSHQKTSQLLAQSKYRSFKSMHSR